jgi:uncharacterized membrane protein YedE/YeeE
MGRQATALLSGVIFGLGLAVSQMVNPAKVLAFLDVAGNWDPSLALVMAGALVVTGIGYRLAMQRPRPVLAERFSLPTKTALDARLIGGAALFGVGWGLIGLCPGPAIASLAYGLPESMYFTVALFVGLWVARLVPN